MKRCRMSNDPLKKVVGRQLVEDGRDGQSRPTLSVDVTEC
jgi:hypothetical protein